MSTPNELVRQWRKHAEILRLYERQSAAILALLAGQLELALQQEGDTALTLQEAAKLSGYSADHLGRMVRDGNIPNAGRKNAPRIRQRDVPRKPGYLPAAQAGIQLAGASAEQIVRAVVNSQN